VYFSVVLYGLPSCDVYFVNNVVLWCLYNFDKIMTKLDGSIFWTTRRSRRHCWNIVCSWRNNTWTPGNCCYIWFDMIVVECYARPLWMSYRVILIDQMKTRWERVMAVDEQKAHQLVTTANQPQSVTYTYNAMCGLQA